MYMPTFPLTVRVPRVRSSFVGHSIIPISYPRNRALPVWAWVISVFSADRVSFTHGSLIFIGVLRIYNVLYFLLLEDLSIFLIVFSGLSSAKWAVVYNTIEQIGSSLFFKIKLPILGNEL